LKSIYDAKCEKFVTYKAQNLCSVPLGNEKLIFVYVL